MRLGKLLAFNPLEEVEAARLVEWSKLARWHGYALRDLLIMVPNGAYLGSDARTRAITMAKLKRAGFRNGVYDYLLAVPSPNHPGLWVELKRRKGAQRSPEQVQFGKLMESLGWLCAVAKGWEEASAAIVGYLDTCAPPQVRAIIGAHD
nr:hypothetical protein [uncultured Rhodopila sp.]